MGYLRSKVVKIVLVDDFLFRSQRIISALDADRRFANGALHHQTLNEAYVAIELAQPDLVIISGKLSGSDEFLMFEAMLKILRTAYIVIGTAMTSETESRAQWSDETHVDAFLDKLDGYLNGARARPKKRPQGGAVGGAPVLIGSSTGGIEALEIILRAFPADCPPTLIVQHIKPHFLDSLVSRLDRLCAPEVVEAVHNTPIRRGVVSIAPGGPRHLELAGRERMVLVDGPPKSGHRPSVDRLFLSAKRVAPETVAVILTGMGRDGAAGLSELRSHGAWTIAQDEATSVVYGMPQAAARLDAVCEELPIHRIGAAILRANARKEGAE